MLIKASTECIQAVLIAGGMAEEIARSSTIEGVEEGNLAITYKISIKDRFCYLKIGEAEGARGGCFIKHLIPVQDAPQHAEKRRKKMRKMLDTVIKVGRSTIVPRPLFFDLSPSPMAFQREKGKERVFAEYRIPETVGGIKTPERLVGMVATLWDGLNISHLPTTSPDKTDVYDPISYPPETVHRTMAAFAEFQRYGQDYIEHEIERKALAGKGNLETVRAHLYAKLGHEQRSLIGFDSLIGNLLETLGWKGQVSLNKIIDGLGDPKSPIHAQLLEKLKEIQEAVDKETTEQLQKSVSERTASLEPFISKEALAKMGFQEIVFAAEREKAWPLQELFTAKRYVQLDVAKKIADLWSKNPDLLRNLLIFLKEFESTYRDIEKLPCAVVTHDSHPFNLFINQSDERISILDLEDLSIAPRIADLATVNIFKIMRAVVGGKISMEEGKKLAGATFEGFDSQAKSPLTSEEKRLMASYTLASFLNHLIQFSYLLNLDPKDLNKLNLAMTSDRFFDHLNLLQKSRELWSSVLPPKKENKSNESAI